MKIIWPFKSLALAVIVLYALPSSAEQKFPYKRVTIVVPYSAGGVTDIFARTLGAKLAKFWGQPVVIENRDGAGTIIGTQWVSRAPADGHTLLFTSYAFTSNPILRKQLPYSKDAFRPVGLLGASHNVLLVTNNLRSQSLRDLIDQSKAAPGSLKLASSGPGSSPHIGAELFAKKVGIDITHVPYKGQGPAMTDLMVGVVDGMFDGMSSYSLVKAGKVTAVAIASDKRHPGAPEVPTFRELGIDFVSGSWFGLLAPVATPDFVVAKINADMRRSLDDEEVRAQISKTGMLITTSSPDMFAKFLNDESSKLQNLIDSGAKIEVN